MRLLELARLLQPIRGDGPLSREVSGLAWDPSRVCPGNLFVAIPGIGRDTQSAVDLALERGAAAILCEGREVVGLRATRLRVSSVRASLPKVAQLFFGLPDRSLKLIGVMGGSDASAAAAMLKSVLAASGLKCGLIGSTECEIGERRLPPLRKNAGTLAYHDLLAQMVRAGCGACIMEFSPGAVEELRLAEIAFDAVVFAGFPAQPDRGGLASLIQFCRAQASGPKRFAGVLNIDDPVGRAMFESRACGRQFSFGFDPGAEVRGSALDLARGSLGMVVAAGDSEILLRTRLTGRQNAMRLLAACAGAIALQTPLALIRFTLQKSPCPPGSLEPVGAGPIAAYVDGSRTEQEISATVGSLREVTSGRVLLALGSAAGASSEQRHHLGRMAATCADYTLITSNNPGSESAAGIAAEIERGYAMGPQRDYHIELNRAQAIHDLIQLAKPGDAVLITGKGQERHQEFADTIVPFDDRDHARAALEFRAAAPVAAAMRSAQSPAWAATA